MHQPYIIPQYPGRTFPRQSSIGEFVFDFLVFVSPSPGFLTTFVSFELLPRPLLFSPIHWSCCIFSPFFFCPIHCCALTHYSLAQSLQKGNMILPVPSPLKNCQLESVMVCHCCHNFILCYFSSIHSPFLHCTHYYCRQWKNKLHATIHEQ